MTPAAEATFITLWNEGLDTREIGASSVSPAAR
jgi:hypothetical protein